MHPIGFKIADKRGEDSGTLTEYADKYPQIRKHYEGEPKKSGPASAMPPL